MKLRMIFLVMDTITLMSLPVLYLYDRLRRLGKTREHEHIL